ncbi:MAG: JAB domain-containing protein [Sphaerochaetaceae bacterium]|nr:JAB domain-containing protein [Sphaerochaetaceae bacterium]
MTDFEKLMQNSETMRMLKIGNPERSKDFGIPDLQVGLFDIEQKTREGLEQIIYNSPDPDGAIAKHDTAIMLNNFGIDMETANKMAEFGFASAATGIDTREKTYWEALKNKAQEAYWTDMRGINTSLYRMTGDTKFLENADEYNAKALKAPLFESYGELGDLVLSGVQPTVSSAKFILTSALLSWIPGGVANKVWGPAVSKVLAKGGGIAANAVNLFSTGYSQAGNVLYDVMQMKDAEGNTLPWDSPIGGVLFHSLAGMMGLVELGSMEMFPWYRQLKTKFTDRELVKHLERGLANAFKNFTFKSIEGTAGESVEEGIQSGLEDGFTNALKAMANKDGAEFDLISLGDSIRKGTKAFLDAGKSMFLTSMLSAGIGQGVVSASLRAKAKKNFNTTDSSVPVDSSFVSVPKTDVEEEGKEEPDSKMDPIRVANVGTHLVPVDKSEARKAAKARKKNAEAMEVIVEDLAPMETDDRLSLLNRAAIATEGKLLGDESIAFEDGDAMNRAIYLLAPNIESVEEKENGADIILRDENGAISRVPLRVLQEGQEGTDPDISYYDDPESPYSLARVSEEQALAWEERETIKRALGDLASHTEGRISTADLESNVDAIKLVADTLGISTDQMLRENLLFKLVKASPEGERGYINNITVDGKKQYTIHLTERADASTLLHEIGHFLRGTATKEQIAEFTAHYGKGSTGVWIEDINKVGDRYVVGDQTFDSFEAALKVVEANEEAFADDFVRYLRTGEAPTEGLSNIFRRMKAVLQRFVLEFGGELDPEVKQMFDNLIVSNTKEGTPPTSSPGIALKQKAPAKDSFQYRMIAKSAHETLKNPDGSLRVFFHGSDRAIDDYSPTQQGLITGANSAGKAFFFTDSEEVAQEYADLAAEARAMREEQMRLEALMDDLNEESERITKQWHNDELDTEEYDQMLEDLEEQINQADEKLASIESSLATGDFNSFPSETDPVLNRVYLGATNILEVEGDVNIDETIEKALLEGYNGVYFRNISDSPSGLESDTVAIFDPDDIYSIGEDQSQPDLFQTAPPTDSEAFKQWFGESKVVDENGNPIELLHGSPNMFDDFIRTQDNDNGYLGAGYYFTGDKGIAQTYATKNNIGYIYHAYLKMDNPLRYDQEWDKEWSKIRDEIVKENPRVEQYSSEFGKLLAEKIQSYGYDGVLDLRNGEVVEAVVFRNEQIRIASVEPYSIESVPRGPLFQESSADDRYFKALEAGDETTAQRIVDEMARRRGYISSNDFRMQHQAPNSKDNFSANLARLDESGLLPKDYWDHPRWYAGDTEMYSFWKVRSALDRLERYGRGNIRLYRAIPKNVKEDWFRNGDWVTPDVEYARNEGRMIPGGYRIISHSVPLEHVWWDVNSIAELGYDDGRTYAYRNTKNNRKLFDLIVRDEDGNIVPPSKRFNYRSDTLYQKSDPLLKAYRHWEPEITSTGIIKGAPEWVKTRKDFNHMMQQMRKFLREGVSGRYWYEQSAEAVWRMMQGDPDKVRKFIQLLAIYSPNNNVPGNTLMAIRAFSHWAAGLPEKDLSSGMSELDNKAKRALYHGEDWEGRKTNSFYINLMYELVRKYPEAFPDMELSDVATMDLWMARAFGYLVEAYSNDKGSGKYSFSENITRRLAAEMNAKLGPLEDPWTPHQVQAAIWSSMKTRYELNHVKASTNKESLRLGYSKLNSKGKVENPTSGENEKLHKQLWRSFAVNKAGTSAEITKAVEETGFSFSEAIYDSSQVVTWESIPSESTGADITHASMATKRQFTREALSLIMDVEGNDLLASMLGVPINYSISSEGAYAGSVSPNIVTSLFPAREKGKEVTFDTVRKYAKAIQYIYKQDAVPFFKPNSVPLVSKTAREEMQFKVVRYSRGRDGSILKETTIPKSKVGTQAEAEQVREDYLAKNPGLSPEDVAVHGGKYSRAMVLSFRNKLNDVILNNVLEELRQYIGEDAGYTRTGSNEIIVVNYRDDFTHAPWMHDEDFLEALDLFIEEQRQALGIVDSASIYTEGEYGEVYNWAESGREETEKALEGGFAGRPDLQAWIRDRRTHYEKLLERYSGEQLRRTEERLRTSLFQKAPPVGSVAFDEKFKNTKIKDANGNPLMVYHGSASLFTDYSSRLLGRNTDALDALQGHFFSTSKDTAESYAVSAMPPRALILKQLREELYQELHDRGLSPTADDPVVRQINWVDSSLEDIEDLIDRGAQSWDPTIIGAYVNLENPVEIDLTDPTVSDEWIGMIAQARQDGHDGVILINDRFTDENTIIVFDDANIGSSAYYLESEGFEEEHEFTHEIDMDSMLKGIDVEVRGELEIIRHDDNENYDEDNLQRIINVIDEELMDLKPESGVDQKYDSQFPDQSLFGLGKAASKELPGWGPLRGDPTQWGYDGTESSPIIDGDWSRLRKIDLKGTKVRSSTDLAKLFSIYRNPKVEYFHVIITKDIGEGAVEILEHHALTSGLPGMTIGVSSRFPKDILEMMIDRRADGFFLLHNHPSGNVKPSKEDFGVSQNYRENIPGFKGHIILDHNKFTMIKTDMSTELYTFLSGEGFHKVPMQSRTSLGVSYSHETVGQYALSIMKDRKGILLYVNTQNEVLDVQPIEDTVDFDDVFATIKREGYVYVFVVTSDETLYEKAIADGEERYQNEGVFVRDVILVKDNEFISALQSAEIYSTSIFSWQQREYRRRHRNHEFDNYVFESSPTLYQLSEEAKQEVLHRRADEVKKAVQAYYWIPDKILEEYAGQEWADRELQFRERLKEFPQLLSMAKEFVDLDEYLEYMRGEVGPWPAADEHFYRRVHAYSRIMTPKEKDAQFVRLHTGTDKALIALGRTLKGYLDVDPKLDRVVHRWGSFKGVSTFVKQLDADSTAEEIQRARALVQQDPRPYRRALQYIEQAEDRVKAYRGELPSGHADREAYYDSLGEDIQEALDSPMNYDDMSDREVAAHLRTTSDKRDQYNARERLATHNGVLALERQANKELKELGAQAKRDIRIVKEELSQAQKELADTKHALEEQGESLKELEEKAKKNGDTAQLKKALEERRERVKDLRSQLTKANERTRALTSRVETLEKREASRKLRDEIERLQKRIKEKIVFRPETLDASYEPMFSAIQRLFGEKMYPVNLPEQMGQYFGSDMMKMIMYGKPIGEWSLEDLGALLDGAHLMRLDARVMLERRILERQNRLQNIAVQIYRQSYGENPEINPGYGSVVGDILDDLTTKREQYQESTFAVIFNTIKSSIGKMQRIARMLDGNKEGYLYDLLVRQAYEKQTEELRESLRRIEEADKVMKELGIDNRALAKDAYTYTMYSGQKKTLTKGEVIGLYVYEQNPIGLQKLIHNRGNGISLNQINEAIDTLTEKEKKWGDYMIDSLGGDETWERMRDVYYEVYNQNLGRRERYFTFIADGVEDEGNLDIINGAMRESLRWVDKGMTKPVNVHAIYPLKLNVTHTYTSQIKRQEHFIQWAGWVRDMNYLMVRGTVGQNIRMRFGKRYYDQVLEYIKDVGSPQSIMDDIEKLGSKIVSNAAVAALSLNFLTMLKQLPSFSAAIRGDIGAIELAQAALRLTNPRTNKQAIEFIHEMSPYMKKRAISVEVEKYQATDFDGAFSSKVQEFNEKIGMKGIQMMDHAAVYTLWLAAYDTYIRRNPENMAELALRKEAAFRATQLISETQPTSITTDLAGVQRKKSPWVRTALLFTNQIFQYINMVWYDLPTSWKNYQMTKDPQQIRKMFGIVMNMAISGGLIILVSGAAFRRDGEDDDEYWERLRNEVFSMIASYSLPYVGSMVSQGLSGFYGGDLVDLPSAFGRALGTDWTDWEKMNKRIWDLLDGVGAIQGLPTAFINRAIKAYEGRNPFELFGANYGRLWEDQ